MSSLLKIEFRKMLKNKLFFVCILIGCIIAILQTIWSYKHIYISNNSMFEYLSETCKDGVIFGWYETGVLQGWLGMEGYSIYNQLFYMIFPLIAVVPFGLSLSKEWDSGYSGQIITRCKRRHYFISKYIVTFASGGIVVVTPLLISLLLSMCYLPVIPVDVMALQGLSGEAMWIKYYVETPLVYAFLFCIIDFLYGGIFALITVVVSRWCSNGFLAVIFPMIANIFTSMGIGNLSYSFKKYIPGHFINPIQLIEYESVAIVGVTVSLLIIVTVLYIISNFKAEELE